MKLVSLKNVSNENIDVALMDGAFLTLPPKAEIKNMNVQEVASLKGKVSFVEDLTEVNQATGRRQIFG